MSTFPHRIVCLTEEPVEILYALGAQHLLAGVSCFVERPPEAKKLPVVTTFTHANLSKITQINPDLAIGYSDVQKDIAKELTAAGINLFISHHRSLEQILDYVGLLGRVVGREQRAREVVQELRQKLEQARARGSKLKRRPRVYLEEWDEPMICGSQWWSELVQVCGGVDIFSGKSAHRESKARVVDWGQVRALGPDMALASWCGKKVDVESIRQREAAPAFIRELQPEIFLQPGMAPIISGADVLLDLFEEWA